MKRKTRKPKKKASPKVSNGNTPHYLLKKEKTADGISDELDQWVNDTDVPAFREFRGQYRTRTRKDAMLAALMKTLGVVSMACQMIGIARKTHYEWRREDEAYDQACEDLIEVKKDFVEHALMKAVSAGEVSAVIFANRTLNRDRGYIERSEVLNTFGATKNITITIPSNDHSDEPTQIEDAQVLPGADL